MRQSLLPRARAVPHSLEEKARVQRGAAAAVRVVVVVLVAAVDDRVVGGDPRALKAKVEVNAVRVEEGRKLREGRHEGGA